MKTQSILKGALLAVGLMQVTAYAEDTDVFLNATASTNDVPNVLFVVDNTANWNTAFTAEMTALASVFESLENDKIRVGIMFANETGNPNNNTKGGYVRAAMRLMDATNKLKYRDMINSFDKLADKGNGGISSLVMAESYRYFSGGDVYAGNGKVKTDYKGNVSGNAANNAVYALNGNALTNINATKYTSPISSGCQKNFIIYLSNGPSQDNNSVKTTSNDMLTAAGGSTTQIPIFPNGSQSNPSDEWAQFMRQSAYSILTYSIDVLPSTEGQGPGWTALLKSMAGDPSRYVAVSDASAANLELAIKSALSQIQAVNSVFASVSLPVSVNTQGTYLNQVFVGMFRPDENSSPRWHGNLKQYKLGGSSTELKLQDADSDPAISGAGTGFLDVCARSFWTPTTADNYWSFNPMGSCNAPSGQPSNYYTVSNFPDGDIVEKGAQAYKLRNASTRNMKTCSNDFSVCGANSTLTSFNTANTAITSALLSTTDANRSNLINWTGGADILDENVNSNSTEMRSSVHGDVVHSRPVALNFGTDDVPEVVVFYGANDGALRAINGNRTAAITTSDGAVAAGAEIWSFVAPESYSILKRIYDNTIAVSTPTIAGSPKPYGIDGPLTAYRDGDTAYVYATMRRGGRAVYAFDMSKISGKVAGTPKMKWKVGCPNNFPSSGTVSDTDCTTGFSEIGQTWSSPKLMTAENYNGQLLIMGGGYDPCEDGDPNTCSAAGYSAKGNKIYVIDALTGALVKSFSTERGVIGDVAILPDTSTGNAKYAYVADLGGNVYRIDIGSAVPASWGISKIASLGCNAVTTCTHNRKFMFTPDIVKSGDFVYVLLGTGDREKPVKDYVNAYGVQNYFFMLKDKPIDETWFTSESGDCGSALLCLDSLWDADSNTAATTQKGWKLTLDSHENVVTSAVTIAGVVTFSTHIAAEAPEAGECTSGLGTARVYNIKSTSAKPAEGDERYELLDGGGLPPSPVAGMVTLDSGETVPFIIGADKTSALEGGAPKLSPSFLQPKARVYWYIEQ